jgi:bacillithiol biosynthesis cysteine-adding enzyme BshC
VDCTARFIPYQDTHHFSSLVLDYVNRSRTLNPFYAYKPDIEGVREAILQRKKFPTNRQLLVDAIRTTHASREMSEAQTRNLDALLRPQTFTVCSAHQPNIFSGYLYFVYKILHTISLAEEFKKNIPENEFVPVFYMGSEDNDLDELSQFWLSGEKYKWETKQKGAVGRMKVDSGILSLIDIVASMLGNEPHGQEVVDMLRESYELGSTVAEATFRLINHLFSAYGLLVLQPDQADLKRTMIPAFRDDLRTQQSYSLVSITAKTLEQHYKVQVNPREINLFYMEDGSRNRLVRQNNIFFVDATGKNFSLPEILEEVETYPERFSPNVVLRGLYQETILPNIAFVGGGSELAYWLELKTLFNHFSVPFPVLVLRNSFLIVSPEQDALIRKTGCDIRDIFLPEQKLMDKLVSRDTKHKLQLEEELSAATLFYRRIGGIAGEVDPTLRQHVAALEKKAVNHLRELEKKMLRAEKRKHQSLHGQIMKLKGSLFPNKTLQERTENILPYYARYGKDIIACLHKHSMSLEMQFGVINVTE